MFPLGCDTMWTYNKEYANVSEKHPPFLFRPEVHTAYQPKAMPRHFHFHENP